MWHSQQLLPLPLWINIIQCYVYILTWITFLSNSDKPCCSIWPPCCFDSVLSVVIIKWIFFHSKFNVNGTVKHTYASCVSAHCQCIFTCYIYYYTYNGSRSVPPPSPPGQLPPTNSPMVISPQDNSPSGQLPPDQFPSWDSCPPCLFPPRAIPPPPPPAP